MDYSRFQSVRSLSIGKLILLGGAGLLLLAVLLRLLGSSIGALIPNGGLSKMMPTSFAPIFDGYATSESASVGYAGSGAPTLSVRNVMAPAPMPPYDTGTIGNDAEAYEVKTYNATIETRALDKDCKTLLDLKGLDYVIFEQANAYDKGCSYTFKVAKAHVEEILAIVNALNPKDLNESTSTIKKTLEDFTSQLDILNKRKQVIETTLDQALIAYDQVTKLAIDTQNAESLTNIINSKLATIERLTQERIDVNAQIESYARAKAEQMDKLDYTYFYVTVYENKFIDTKELKDSWVTAIKTFVADSNRILQDVSINLIIVVLMIVQWGLYLLLATIAARFGWKLIKRIWNRS